MMVVSHEVYSFFLYSNFCLEIWAIKYYWVKMERFVIVGNVQNVPFHEALLLNKFRT